MTENAAEGMVKALFAQLNCTCESHPSEGTAQHCKEWRWLEANRIADALAAAGYGDVQESEEALECCREQRTDLRELVDVERERAEKAEALYEEAATELAEYSEKAEREYNRANDTEAKTADVLADLKALVDGWDVTCRMSPGVRELLTDFRALIAKHETE